jgi:hypothetical protein
MGVVVQVRVFIFATNEPPPAGQWPLLSCFDREMDLC